MSKKDPIFWWASGIFVLSLALFAVTQDQFWLALMIGSYLLRPTLASLGLARRYVDERQMSLHYRSGNIAFAVMIVACLICAIVLASDDNHDFEMFIMVIVVGLAAKALFNVVLAKSYRKGASKIIIAAGLLIALFSTFDVGSFVGILVSALPGLAIAGIGLLSMKYPRPIGIVIFVATGLLEVAILSRGFNWAQIGTAVIIGVPLTVAGICLLITDKGDTETHPKSTVDSGTHTI
jgi:hypothetical protein